MKLYASPVLSLTVFMLCAHAHGCVDIFGSGSNQFDIEFVEIGDPNNADDITGSPSPMGRVEYSYGMGKFEVSQDMINKANNAAGLGITYYDHGGANKPATDVTWYEAAMFTNWLNTSTGHTPAYKFDGGEFRSWQPTDVGYNPANIYRNSQAKYFLPSADEWHKAAYYNSESETYYDYTTGSDTVPDGIDFAGDTEFEAVIWDGFSDSAPNDIFDVGALSPYGTAGQGGNVWEWEETEFDLINSGTPSRGVRGGFWGFRGDEFLLASWREGYGATSDVNTRGFRVATSISVPEPGSAIFLALSGLLGLSFRRKPLGCSSAAHS